MSANTESQEADIVKSNVPANLALILSFFMALIPLLHKFPAVGSLPRIGPFEAEPFRASVLVLCATIAVILTSLGRQWQGRGALTVAGYAVDAAVLGIIAYASWRF